MRGNCRLGQARLGQVLLAVDHLPHLLVPGLAPGDERDLLAQDVDLPVLVD